MGGPRWWLGVAAGIVLLGGPAGSGNAAAAGTDLAVAFVSQVPGQPESGWTAKSTWRVSNVGQAAVEGVAVSFTFTTGSSPNDLSGSATILGTEGYCSNGTGSGCWVSAAVHPGESFDVLIYHQAFVGPYETRVVSTTVAVRADGDSNSANDSASADIVNVRPPGRSGGDTVPPTAPRLPTPAAQKVQMDAVAAPSATSVTVGDTVSVHYTITNNGNIEPAQYYFNPRVEGAAAIVSATPSSGRCSEDNGMMCGFNRLQPGTTVSLDVVLRVTSPGSVVLRGTWVAKPGAAPLAAYFFSSGADITLTAVPRSADLRASISLDRRRVRVGTAFPARVTLASNGPHDAGDVAVLLGHRGLRIVKVVHVDAVCSGTRSRCVIPKLLAGMSTTLVAWVVADGPGRKTLDATVGYAGGGDPDATNNYAVASITVLPKRRHAPR